MNKNQTLADEASRCDDRVKRALDDENAYWISPYQRHVHITYRCWRAGYKIDNLEDEC
jgi:hypothetical protein